MLILHWQVEHSRGGLFMEIYVGTSPIPGPPSVPEPSSVPDFHAIYIRFTYSPIYTQCSSHLYPIFIFSHLYPTHVVPHFLTNYFEVPGPPSVPYPPSVPDFHPTISDLFTLPSIPNFHILSSVPYSCCPALSDLTTLTSQCFHFDTIILESR